MRKTYLAFVIIFIASSIAYAQSSSLLMLKQKISLPGVRGRLDHMAIDLKGKKLFVSALDNNTLEIVDLNLGKAAHTIKNLSEPQGVAFVPKSGKIYVTNGGRGNCDVFDATSFENITTIQLGEDADNMRFDPVAGHIYIGYGEGAVGIIDSANDMRIGDIPMPSHPEAFEFEKDGNRLFVNVPNAKSIVTADRSKIKVQTSWQLTDARENFPMAIDEANHRLFVGCRSPAKLLILDTVSGKTVAEIKIDGDVDDIFYDAGKKRIYISCGDGFIDVIEQRGVSIYNVAERIPTAKGARTSFFTSDSRYYYLAVPAHGNNQAEIWVYETR